MIEFEVAVIEILERRVKVTATSSEDAVNHVKRLYNNEQIVLDKSDWSNTIINAVSYEGGADK